MCGIQIENALVKNEEITVKPYTYTPLLTDLYQFTMAYGYWLQGLQDCEAVFHLIFRKNPFKGNYALNCGLESVIDYLSSWHFKPEELDYLANLKNAAGGLLFSQAFIDYLSQVRFSCDLDAIAEGTLVFPNEPLLRIQGPILQCQLLESALLNMINFQTLIATKASRVYLAAQGDDVIEFGLRRAQGPDGAVSASRAAYVGGAIATSNTLAGMLFDIPVRGTHAHSWVTAFPSEREAFLAYAKSMPNNCVLLVDTYDTLQGVLNAIEVGKILRKQGADLLGIRLDSGDLAQLSIKARKLLDSAGFEKTDILASNSIDEYVIKSLKAQGAKISSWGVGTHLTTAYDHPALDGVYKLSAIQNDKGDWLYKLKLSEQPVKISNPGRHQIRRFFAGDQLLADVVYDLQLGIPDAPTVSLFDPLMQPARLDDYDAAIDLLEPVFRRGKLVQTRPSIHKTREFAIQSLPAFVATYPERSCYSVGLEKNLAELKLRLIDKVKVK